MKHLIKPNWIDPLIESDYCRLTFIDRVQLANDIARKNIDALDKS